MSAEGPEKCLLFPDVIHLPSVLPGLNDKKLPSPVQSF